MKQSTNSEEGRGVTASHNPTGGRIASDQFRKLLNQCQEFKGLDEKTSRFDLLHLVKRAGRLAGFHQRMIELLDYYLGYTRDIDWEEGGLPIVYQSKARTAMELGLSERQISNLERALCEAGAMVWQDSGNHKRYGQRDPETGAIKFAYGVDLRPLAFLKDELAKRLEEKRAHDNAWMELKRQISWYRAQIRAHIVELEQADELDPPVAEYQLSYERIAVQIRTHMKIELLQELLEKHKALYERVLNAVARVGGLVPSNASHEALCARKTQNISPREETGCAHKEVTTHKEFDKSNTSSRDNCHPERVGDRLREQRSNSTPGGNRQRHDRLEQITSTGLQHITLKHVMAARTESFRAHMGGNSRQLNWSDFVNVADRVRLELRISHENWVHACQTLTRNGAAICMLITDAGASRDENPVRKPGAYFKAMINRAEQGKLNLQRSIFGLMKAQG